MATRLKRLRRAIRNRWRKCQRAPYYTDLRLVKLEHRHLYKDYFQRGTVGHALGALYRAYHAGHLRSQDTQP